jgi:hypothetical protein
MPATARMATVNFLADLTTHILSKIVYGVVACRKLPAAPRDVSGQRKRLAARGFRRDVKIGRISGGWGDLAAARSENLWSGPDFLLVTTTWKLVDCGLCRLLEGR